MTRTENINARVAHEGDREAFMALAQLSIVDSGTKAVFHEATANYTFAGIARFDPAILLLFEGEEIIGFSLCRMRRMPFCDAYVWTQEALFVRPDKRSAVAEAKLWNLMREMAAVLHPAEIVTCSFVQMPVIEVDPAVSRPGAPVVDGKPLH